MTIGQLYDTRGVVVGQAACLVAPANTPLPDITKTALVLPATVDPFDITPWTYMRLYVTTLVSAGSFTLTYTFRGVAYTTASNVYNVTASALDTSITAALAPLGVLAGDVIVSGGPASAVATPLLIALSEPFTGGTWTITPTTVTGGPFLLSAPLWTPIGATDQGWTWNSNKSITDINIEEQSSPVARTMDTQAVTVEGAAAEDISRVIALAFNMYTAYTANGSAAAGYETLSMTDDILTYAVALIMQNNLGYSRWLYVPQATSLSNVSAAFRRANAKRMYSIAFGSICPISSIQLQNVLQRGT